MLHIVNKSPAQSNALDTCLRLVQAGDALLLIEDGVFGATRGGGAALADAAGRVKVYALKPDLDARGMAERLLDGVETVDYGGFVDLVAEHNTCQSWL